MSEETEKTPDQKNSRWALPHVFVLLFGIIVFATIMTWILPAGDFNRVTNSAGQKIVQAGTYHLVKAHPVGFFEMFKVYLPWHEGRGAGHSLSLHCLRLHWPHHWLRCF